MHVALPMPCGHVLQCVLVKESDIDIPEFQSMSSTVM